MAIPDDISSMGKPDIDTTAAIAAGAARKRTKSPAHCVRPACRAECLLSRARLLLVCDIVLG